MRSFLWVLAACGTRELPQSPSYVEDVDPILSFYCEQCHTAAGNRRDGGVELDQYRSARSNRLHIACTSLDSRLLAEVEPQWALLFDYEDPVCSFWTPASMPIGAREHLSADEQQILVNWINTGAQP